MEFSLVKQLKDAGFPLKECKVGPDCEQWWYFPHKEAIHAPTLEELIEACGDGFDILQKHDTRWGVTGHSDFLKETDFYLTPTEAVAKLWLALQAKE